MTTILNVEPDGFSPRARAILASLGELREEAMGRDELLQTVGAYDVLVTRLGHRIDREVLEAGDRLQVVATATTGLDHIDVDCARDRGVTVLSLRGETDFLRTITATAEHAWALLLATVRRIPSSYASVLDGRWDRDRFRGHELAGKGLGILGLGRVGSQVARYAQAFGMSVTAFDIAEVDPVPGVGVATDLSAMLGVADVLSIHATLDTAVGVIGRAELALMPQGAILVNTARAGIVDESALLDALRSGHLAGAALDVIDGELDAPTRESSPLLAYARRNENVIVTPHVGGATVESMEKTELFMAEKLARFLRGEGS